VRSVFAVFVLYSAFIVAGLAVYIAIGLLHR